jgi:hypothetical protein
MNRVLRTTLLCFAAIAALAFAACGNGEQNDYVDQVNEVQQSFLDQVTEAASTPATNPQQVGEMIAAMQDAFTTAADDLSAIDPPEEVTDLHAQLTSTMADLGDQVAEVGKALQGGNPAAAQQAALQLQSAITTSQEQVTQLIDDINAQLQG